MADEKEVLHEVSEEKVPLTLDQRRRLFWYAPEFEQARRFAGDPEEYHYDDIEEDTLDEVGVPKYAGEPLPIPAPPKTGHQAIMEALFDVDTRPAEEKNNYLQVATWEPTPIDPLLDAHQQVMMNLCESRRHRPTDPFAYMEECLLVADVFAAADDDAESTELFLRLPQPHCVTHDPREGILALMVQLSDRGWKAEIFSDFKTPTEEDRRYYLRLSIRVTPDGPVQAKYWGYSFDTSKYNFTGHEKLSVSNLNTVEAYEGYWLLMDRYSILLDEVAAAHQMVGDLSEGVLLCSYNEDDIRHLWINGQLNERIKRMSESMPWEYDRFLGQMGDKVREDGDYEAALTERIAAVNGWPKRWSTDPNDLDPLTIQEQLKVLPLQLQEPDSRQQALNRYCDLRAELEKRLPSNATGTNA